MLNIPAIMSAPLDHIGAVTHLVLHANNPHMRARYRALSTQEQEAFFEFISLSPHELSHAYLLVAREQLGKPTTREAIEAFLTRVAELRTALERDRAAKETS